MCHRTKHTAVLLTSLLVLTSCIQAGDWVDGECDDGELDRPRFCDRTGDLVADRPPSPDQWIDPDTLIFAYTPVEDPAQYREVWDDFLDHLERITGRDVQFFAAQSNAAQIEAMRAGRLHIAGFSTGAVPLAVNCAGFVPTVMMADGDEFGYEMEIITHVDSGLDSVADLDAAHTFAFTSPTSNSGFKTPTVFLQDEHGFEPDVDFEVDYSGGHDNSLIGVHQRDYDAAAVANEVTDRIMERGDVPADEIEVLHRSETFPTTAFGLAYDLKPQLAEDIRQAFLTFPWWTMYRSAHFPTTGKGPFTVFEIDPQPPLATHNPFVSWEDETFTIPWRSTTIGEEFSDSDRFIPIEYQEHWEMIRDVDSVFEDGYSCR